MPSQPFSLANLREVGEALYGRQWHAPLSWKLKIPERAIKGWFNGKRLPDLREQLADVCRRHDARDPAMERMARKLEALGPPE